MDSPYGGVRWENGTLPTDYRFTGQRLADSLQFLIDIYSREDKLKKFPGTVEMLQKELKA